MMHPMVLSGAVTDWVLEQVAVWTRCPEAGSVSRTDSRAVIRELIRASGAVGVRRGAVA